jgi:5'-deoxynucleotidase YfbR-like HD superfamily hydrolase
MRSTIEFIIAGSEVNRYHTMMTLQRETVGHHSHGVACLTLLLNPGARRELLIAALYHDLAEQHTGDIPSPAKREYGIGDQVATLEKRLMSVAGLTWPALTPDEERVLKLADLAHGALSCTREIGLGNRRMRGVFSRFMSYAESMNLSPAEKQLFDIIQEIVDECE